ncbi:hypothetical protein [Algibacter sp. 2305UL17-15]|uniref:hypothetical protein n=1 Tax=Algibacter sp. 2305UL17-15 TaxID=3231268 RepID=UPI00345A7C3F
MKNVLNNSKKAILMVAMMATVIGNTNASENHDIKDAKRTAITLTNVKQGNLLTIKDAYGITLYTEQIKEEGMYSKGFDLSELPNGDYVVELDKDVEIKMIPFTVEDNTVVFNKAKEETFFKPVTRVKENLVYVSKLALDNENLDVSIYLEGNRVSSNDYELVYSENIKNDISLERVYKLPREGNYKVVYHSQGRSFTAYINN